MMNTPPFFKPYSGLEWPNTLGSGRHHHVHEVVLAVEPDRLRGRGQIVGGRLALLLGTVLGVGLDVVAQQVEQGHGQVLAGGDGAPATHRVHAHGDRPLGHQVGILAAANRQVRRCADRRRAGSAGGSPAWGWPPARERSRPRDRKRLAACRPAACSRPPPPAPPAAGRGCPGRSSRNTGAADRSARIARVVRIGLVVCPRPDSPGTCESAARTSRISGRSSASG